MLRLLEWGQGCHRYRAELRDLDERRVWFVAVDDELPHEAFEASEADANLFDLRRRLVRSVLLADMG